MVNKGIHLAECPHKLVNGWIERGNKEEDVLFKFVSYWIAINQLYNYHGDEDDSESERIKAFSRKYYKEIAATVDYQADYMKIFKERPILRWYDTTDRYDWRMGNEFVSERIMNKFSNRQDMPYFESNCKDAARCYVRICDPKYNDSFKSEALLMSIYRVRCNLFHGNKDPDLRRNYDLIESSARILEILLPVLKDAVVR